MMAQSDYWALGMIVVERYALHPVCPTRPNVICISVDQPPSSTEVVGPMCGSATGPAACAARSGSAAG